MSSCGLHGRIPLGFGELSRLKSIDLSLNENLTASCSQLFRAGWEKIEVISLASNKLHGNNLTGTLPEVLRMGICKSSSPLPSLQHLDLSVNRLVGKLPEWLGQLENLVELSLSGNSLYGPIPSTLGSLTNISALDLGYNKLNGTLPDSLGKLSELSVLDVSSNHLTGVVTETHFSQLSKLKILLLSSNSLTLNVSSNWIPPFLVRNLDLGSCHLGPSFPAWIRSQKEVEFLDFSNASISGSIPNWFWEISSNLSLLNISFNQLGGQVPNPFNASSYAEVDLSSNFFEGPIPFPIVDVALLDLSNNVFSGHIPKAIGETIPNMIFLSLSGNQLTGEIPASIGEILHLQVIDFSNNSLNGSIPPTIANCSFLKALDLSKNNLSGNIPSSLGQLSLLQTMHLSDNKLSGRLPQALQNLSSLETLDIGNNMLTGSIPPWIGKGFEYLRILRLRSNAFFGELPIMLSNLSSLHVLDLAENQLNGSIPASFGDFKAMAQVENTNRYLFYGKYRGVYYEESLVVNLKGSPQIHTKFLFLVISIDVSGNQLSGDIPEEITNLAGLIALDLSKNHISGHIPEGISKLKQLQSLDLSSNKLTGPIPQSLSLLSFLGYLNLSNNDFTGRIPYTGQLTTFDAPSFAGNPGLCGAPFLVSCPDDDPDKGKTPKDDGDGNDFIDKWFYLSVGLGFASGVLVPFFILAIRKSWSVAYFRLVDQVLERISECHA